MNKKQLFETVMKVYAKRIYDIMKSDEYSKLFELSHQTIKDAANAVRNKQNALYAHSDDGVIRIDDEKFKQYLETINNPKQRDRLIKLNNSGKLVGVLRRQNHLFGTIANNGIEWLRDNTDIAISPRFFDGDEDSWGEGHRNVTRQETDEENKFYRYFTSGMTDTEGMNDSDIARFDKAITDLFTFLCG